MATKITIKLYDYYNNFVKQLSLVSRVAFYDAKRAETTLEHIEPPVKRATKNLDSLIKALNKQGYTVSLTQILDSDHSIVWDCFIHDENRNQAIIGHTSHMQKTAYLAIKEAVSKIQIRLE